MAAYAFTYIKKNVRGYYVGLPNELDPTIYVVGTSWEDFNQNNKWVKLSDEQVAFKEENTGATVEEVWNMALTPPKERTLDDAKSEKLSELSHYHYQHVSDMSYDGTDVWVDKYQRGVVINEANAATAQGKATVKVTKEVSMNPSDAVTLMGMMSERENECEEFFTSKQAEINEQTDIDECDAIVVSDGYPKKEEVTSKEIDAYQETEAENNPEKQAVSLLRLKINTMELTDNDALTVKLLYPKWETFIDKSLSKGMRVLYDNKLYNVRQEINPVLEIYPPSIDTAALYEEIAYQHEGTLNDPIPYNNNMELFNGKYYTQSGVIYLCNRDTEQPVYHNLADLVGLYVQVVS